MLDLMIPENAYMYGLFQADASCTKYSITLNASLRDVDIAYKLNQVLSNHHTSLRFRTKHTEFQAGKYKYDREVFVWSLCKKQFVDELGIETGKKHMVVKPPERPYSEPDYWRGIIDGDGSIGFRVAGRKNRYKEPYLGLVLSSEEMKDAFIDLLEKFIGFRRKTTRNARDNVYNIMVNGIHVPPLATWLYYPNCLGINRKIESANQVMSWERPAYTKKPWSPEDISFAVSHTVDDTVVHLGKSRDAVLTKLQRLRKLASIDEASQI